MLALAAKDLCQGPSNASGKEEAAPRKPGRAMTTCTATPGGHDRWGSGYDIRSDELGGNAFRSCEIL
jgi:hypothetical protein